MWGEHKMRIQSLTRLGVLLAAGSLLAPGLWAVDAPLVGDTYVSAAAPAGNYGIATSLVIAPGNSGLVQFDLSGIPASSTIAKAYLCVYVNKVTTAGTLSLAPATTSWTEGAVTYNTQPTVGSVFTTASVSLANTFVLVDVTTEAQAWMATPASNFGVEITGTGSTSVQLDSKEGTATSHPAELALTIIGPAGATGAIGAVGPTGSAGATGLAGATGAAGAPGLAGAIGPTGPAGPTGIAGAAGAAGAPGLAGAIGPTGPAGPTGIAGAAGAAGAAGLAGARGPTGFSGPAGPTGAAGATGVVGPQGATGATGTNGPNGLRFNFDTTLHGTYTIPDADTHIYYLSNNPVGTSSACGSAPPTITLPHSLTVGSGRMVVISPGNVPNITSGQCIGVTIGVQSGDTLIPTGVTSSVHPMFLISDGAGHWIIFNTDGQ